MPGVSAAKAVKAIGGAKARSSAVTMQAGRLVSKRSKTGNPACSQAMSLWVRSRHGGPAVAAEVFKILAKCRQQAAQNRGAVVKQASGKLAEGRGTWQRSERAAALKAKRAPVGPPSSARAAPSVAQPWPGAKIKAADDANRERAKEIFQREMRAIQAEHPNLGAQYNSKAKRAALHYDVRSAGGEPTSAPAATPPADRFSLATKAPHRAKQFESSGGKTKPLLEELRGANAKDLPGQRTMFDHKPSPKIPAKAPGRGTPERATLATAHRVGRDLVRQKAPASAPPKLSLREQVAARREARGLDSPKTRAGVVGITKTARDARRAKRQPAKTPDATAPTRTHGDASSAPFATRFHAAFDRLDNGGANYVHVGKLREALPDVPRATFDAELRKLRMAGHYAMDSHEGNRGPKLTAEQHAASIKEGPQALHWIARKGPRPVSGGAPVTSVAGGRGMPRDDHPGRLPGESSYGELKRRFPDAALFRKSKNAIEVRASARQNKRFLEREAVADPSRNAPKSRAEMQAIIDRMRTIPRGAALSPKLHETATTVRGDVKAITHRENYHAKRKRLADAAKAGRAADAKPASSSAPAPGSIGEMRTADIHTDPTRFQYKMAHAEGSGSVGSLEGTSAYNHDLAGVQQVWTDPANGKTFVVNGHNRLDLAKRKGVAKIRVAHLDAKTAEEARSIGARTNIAEGRGTSLDAAKFMRDTGATKESLQAHGITLKEKTAHEGAGLAGLHPKIFDRVVSGEITAERGAIIGGSGLSHDQQSGLMASLARVKKAPTNTTLREHIDNAKSAPTVKTTTRDLFGTNEEETSLALHRATLQGHIKEKLASEKRIFGTVAKERNAADLERGGNTINAEQSGQISKAAGENLAVFDLLKNRKGHVADLLNEGTKRLHSGEKAKAVHAEIYKRLPEAIRATLAGGP